MPVNRSIKEIPIIICCFLFILTEMFTWFVLSPLIYPRSIEKCFTWKNRKLFISLCA
jgi:predicted small integral membrane protein